MRVCVIGGGAIGSAIAMFLGRLGEGRVQVDVVERDPTYAQASSALSASSIRQQFSNAINVRMSRFGLEWVRHFDVGFVESGYLFLAASDTGAAELRARQAMQRELDAPIVLLSPADTAARFPWLRTDDLQRASLGTAGEGWFDGYAFTQALKHEAQALGAHYRRDDVVALPREGRRIRHAGLRSGERIEADLFVNAAGPWARQLALLAGLHVPVYGRRRTVFHLSCPTPLPRTPLVIDTSGVWFRSEGAGFLAGWSPADGEPDPDDLPLDAELGLFEERLWPALAERVPAFEALRVERAWAGYYEVHPLDHNALIGPHPEADNLLLCNGFSGHGLQHAPAAGRGVAELALYGRYRTLDLSPFGFERVLRGAAFAEKGVI
jgi:glycine/D-amino acid oxidase-like deaminating enzyme